MVQLQTRQTPNMTIADQDLEYIKSQMLIWMKEADTTSNYNKLTERIIRVEEGLKTQIQLMQQGFEQVDQQLQLQRGEMNRRFEQVDEQLRLQREEMDRRFKEVDKRFEQIDKRFEQIDKRFEQVDKRFEQVDRRFDKMFVNFRWAVTAMIAFWGVTLGAMQFILSQAV